MVLGCILQASAHWYTSALHVRQHSAADNEALMYKSVGHRIGNSIYWIEIRIHVQRWSGELQGVRLALPCDYWYGLRDPATSARSPALENSTSSFDPGAFQINQRKRGDAG